MKFYYVCVLYSYKDKKFYKGFTNDLKERYTKHELGEAKSTKPRRPLELAFFEAYRNKCDALRREKYLKTNKGLTTLRAMLKEFLKDLEK